MKYVVISQASSHDGTFILSAKKDLAACRRILNTIVNQDRDDYEKSSANYFCHVNTSDTFERVTTDRFGMQTVRLIKIVPVTEIPPGRNLYKKVYGVENFRTV